MKIEILEVHQRKSLFKGLFGAQNEYKQITSSEKNATFNFNQWKARMENKMVNEGDSLISFSFFDSFADLFEKERIEQTICYWISGTSPSR